MDKDKLIEEMLNDMGDRSNTIDLNAYGKGLIDMYDKLVKNCSIPDVVGQSEQLCGNLDSNLNCKNMCLTHCIDGNKFWK